MIVDDHMIFRKGLETLIKASKYVNHVHQAANEIEMRGIFNNHTIHLTFMDIRIPDVDGFQLTRFIKSISTDTKIVGLSMLDDKSSIMMMFRAGASGYILKNCDKAELTQVIQQVLIDGNIYISKTLPETIYSEILQDVQNNHTSDNTTFTKRELDIFKVVCQGYSNNESAMVLRVSEKSIEANKARLFDKTGANNTVVLIKYVYKYRIINKI